MFIFVWENQQCPDSSIPVEKWKSGRSAAMSLAILSLGVAGLVAVVSGHGAVTHPKPRQAIDGTIAPWNGTVPVGIPVHSDRLVQVSTRTSSLAMHARGHIINLSTRGSSACLTHCVPLLFGDFEREKNTAGGEVATGLPCLHQSLITKHNSTNATTQCMMLRLGSRHILLATDSSSCQHDTLAAVPCAVPPVVRAAVVRFG